MLVLTACGTEAPSVEADLDQTAARLGQVQDDMAAVAQAQLAAAPGLPGALAAIRTIDDLLPLLDDAETFDDGLSRMAVGGVALDLVDLGQDRATIREVAFAVDRARVSLRRAQDVLDIPEDLAYLTATDVVLQAVRVLAASQDALAQVVARHLPTYRDLQALASDFRDRRSRFRSRDEAADAFSVEARELLRRLVAAQTDIATFVAERDAAAKDVNAAQSAAIDAFRARGTEPDGSSAPTDGVG